MDNNIFENGWNDMNAYAFGWVMSDGCLTREGRNKTAYAVRITSNDREIVEWLHEYMCVGNKIYRVGERCYQIKFRNLQAIEYMMIYGLKERKSLNMLFPHNIPEQFMPHFIRGYFDGDGSMVLHTNEYNTYA